MFRERSNGEIRGNRVLPAILPSEAENTRVVRFYCAV
jgi:hypothetical protein